MICSIASMLEARRWENQFLHDLFNRKLVVVCFGLPMTGIAFSLLLKQSPEEGIRFRFYHRTGAISKRTIMGAKECFRFL